MKQFDFEKKKTEGFKAIVTGGYKVKILAAGILRGECVHEHFLQSLMPALICRDILLQKIREGLGLNPDQVGNLKDLLQSAETYAFAFHTTPLNLSMMSALPLTRRNPECRASRAHARRKQDGSEISPQTNPLKRKIHRGPAAKQKKCHCAADGDASPTAQKI